MKKNDIRLEILKDLKMMDKCTYEQYSFEIARRLYQHPAWKKANTVAVTVSRSPEIDTWQIIRTGWMEGKRIVVPKCIPESKQMVFKQLTSFTQLESVFFGLFEPINQETVEVKKNEIDLMIVPGVAFDQKGYRIGFGGGYYDRYLQSYQGETLSLAISMQVLETIPLEKHDIPVKSIITEKSPL